MNDLNLSEPVHVPSTTVVGLGHGAAEEHFDWDSTDRDTTFEAILALIGDLTTAEVVAVWGRRRFLWWTWETCEFRRAADVVGDPHIARVSAWPAPTL
jgi:hypothetical protein